MENNKMLVDKKLNNKSSSLSYHYVRYAVSAEIITMEWLETNRIWWITSRRGLLIILGIIFLEIVHI